MNKLGHPILTCAEALALEQRLLGGRETAEWAAMKRAGRSLGQRVLKDFLEIAPWPESPRLLVLAGRGHNAGDALLAAGEILKQHSKAQVEVLFVYGSGRLKQLAQRSLDALQKIGSRRVRLHTWRTGEGAGLSRDDFDVCIDGILGMQFQPPLRPPGEEVLRWVNGLKAVRLRAAVDLPSGVGDACAEECFRADFTYATGSAKAPLFEPGNSASVGRIRYIDLDFFNHESGPDSYPRILIEQVLDPLRGLRDPATDKRKYGHLFILGGSRTMPGAIEMSALAAVSSGVGLVTAFVPESVAAEFAAAVPEVMWVPWPETSDGGLAPEGFDLLQERMDRATALLAGPGMGREDETQSLLQRMVRDVGLPMVLDADSLQLDVINAAADRPEDAGGLILTPHFGEFRRIIRSDKADYEPEALQAFCRDKRLVTILKGPITHICDGERLIHSTFGGPLLARGGSGDILCGLVGSLLARPEADPLETACAAVAWHGLAADALARARGPEAVKTTDILPYLSAVLRHEC